MKTKKVLLNIGKTLVLPVALYALFLLLNSLFGNTVLLTSTTGLNMIYRNTVMVAILSYGVSYNLNSGRFDFSLGAVWLLSGIMAANLASQWGLGAFGMLFLAMAIGAVLAAWVSLVYMALRVPTMVTALGMLLIYEALSAALFGGFGASVSLVPSVVIFAKPLVILAVFAVVFIGIYIINNYTAFGYHTRALARGQKVAVRIGIQEKKNAVMCWVISGICCGIAVTLNLANIGLLMPKTNFGSSSTLIDTLLPCMLGTFLGRYSENTTGILIGALSVQILKTGLSALQLDPNLQTICVIMFLFAYIMYTSVIGEVERNRALKKRALSLADYEGRTIQ